MYERHIGALTAAVELSKVLNNRNCGLFLAELILSKKYEADYEADARYDSGVCSSVCLVCVLCFFLLSACLFAFCMLRRYVCLAVVLIIYLWRRSWVILHWPRHWKSKRSRSSISNRSKQCKRLRVLNVFYSSGPGLE